jgi:hypothetical protein
MVIRRHLYFRHFKFACRFVCVYRDHGFAAKQPQPECQWSLVVIYGIDHYCACRLDCIYHAHDSSKSAATKSATTKSAVCRSIGQVHVHENQDPPCTYVYKFNPTPIPDS